MTPELKQLVVANKSSLLAHLQRYQQPQHPMPAIGSRPDPQFAPLSFSQQRLWFIDQLERGSAHFNAVDSLDIQGDWQEQAFATACQQLLQRHEILRTCYVQVDGEPYQQILPVTQLSCQYIDYSTLDSARQQQAMQQLAQLQIGTAFDLTQDLLLRVLVVKQAADHHCVLLVTHHIATDGWSRAVLKQDLTALYQAALTGSPDPLPPLTVQYADYAYWQRQWLQGDVLAQQLEYWKVQLQDMPVLHSLPLDRARQPGAAALAKVVRRQYCARTLEQLQALCQQHQVTLFMLMHAAFVILLSRYSHERDIVTGTAIAGRVQQELEPLVGFFVNDLVLRAQPEPLEAFSAFLARHRNTILDAYQHQHVPFELVVETLNPVRSLQHHPLYQIKLDLHNQQGHVVASSGSDDTAVQSREDLYLSISQHSDGLSLAWHYNSDLWDEHFISQLADSLTVLVSALLADSDCVVAQLPVLNSTQQQPLLSCQAHQVTTAGNTALIHQLIEQFALSTPDELAVVAENESLTYQALNRRANQLAHFLRAAGVQPDTLVGLCVERSVDMIVGILAILKAGGAYVPMDPAYPENRLQFMLDDCALQLVLTQEALTHEIDFGRCKTLALDSEWLDHLLQNYPVQNPEPAVVGLAPHHLAYAIYTSGSTGIPRAVLISHANLMVSTLARHSAYPQAPQRFLLLSSYAFDSSVAGIFWTLSCGGRLVIGQTSDGLDPAKFGQLLAEQQLTHLLTLPSVYSYILGYPQLSTNPLRQVIVAGEVCPPQLPLQHMADPYWRHCQLINEYGPTEGSVWSAYYDCADYRSGTVPIGRNAPHVSLYVVDDAMQLSPVGVTGELLIGGPGVSCGYLQRPELTTSLFVADPFSSDPAARVYKTGDLVRWNAQGQLEYLGRRDSQLKIRGYRLELSEIEASILQLPEVRSAAVTVDTEHPTGPRLIAYLTMQQSLQQIVFDELSETDDSQRNFELKQNALIQSLRTALKLQLPDYMIPSVFMLLEQLPLLPNGKVDKQALPKPRQSDTHNEVYVAASTATEQTLTEIWQEVLQLSQIGVLDNFFMLGGHSLLATKLISLIRQRLSAELPLKLLFEKPTIAALALEIDAQTPTTAQQILPVDRNQPHLLSYAQQRLWFIDSLSGGSAQYNVPKGFYINGVFHHKAFQQALRALLQRHESLRTCFVSNQGEVLQFIQQQFSLPLIQHDLSDLPEDIRQTQLQHLIRKEAKLLFDLSQDLMLRVRLVRLAPESHVVLYTMHHIASDGWSASILQRELDSLYQAFSRGDADPLPPMPLQYLDYAIWQRQWLQGDLLTQQLDYWLERLAGAPAVHRLPLDKPRPAVQGTEGQFRFQRLDKALTAQIRQQCQARQLTLFMFMQTAFSVLLSRFSNDTDIVVGSPIAGRTHLELESLIGFFVNSLALRLDLSGNPTFAGLLSQNKQHILDAYAHQHIPFELIVEKLRPERQLNHHPLFQITFAVQNNEAGVLDQQQSQVTDPGQLPVALKPNIRVDLELHVIEQDDELLLYWLYNDQLFADSSIIQLSDSYQVLLEHILATLDSSSPPGIQQLQLLRDSQRHLLLKQAAVSAAPATPLVHQLFSRQAQQTPLAVAVSCDTQSLDYRSLDQQSNQLAHYLRTQGVQPGALVPLYLERSTDMVLAMLAVLKCGAAFIPLDLAAPASRLAAICHDCEATLLLTQPQQAQRGTLPAIPQLLLGEPAVRAALAQQSTAFEGLPELKAPDTLAYVLYTSGSTGTPKGVKVAHRNLVHLGQNMQQFVAQICPDHQPVWALNAEFHFDASLQGFSQLMFGGQIRLIPVHIRRDASELSNYLCNCAADFFDCTPSQLRSLLEHSDPADLPALVIGGEKIGATLWQQLVDLALAHQVVSLNVYGPTEACVNTTWCRIDNHTPRESLGDFLPGASGYVVSLQGDSAELVPPGVVGELWIAGAGVACGYLNRPELTAEKFIADPFNAASGWLYRSGDLVRRNAAGQLEFIARCDEQFKLRGYRIETGDIESCLQSHPALSAAVVSVQQQEDSDARLIAYVSPTQACLQQVALAANERELAQWTEVFDSQYRDAVAVAAADANFVGWNSSYTDQPIALAQMTQWRERTLKLITGLQPRRLLEVGCGTGLLLFGYAASCSKVWALDLSAKALQAVQAELDKRQWHHVQLAQGDALNLQAFAGERFDTVVINSVAQYFPNPQYLQQVIEQLMPLLVDGGRILFGDIRNMDLYESHLAAAERSQLHQSLSVNSFRGRLQRRMQQEPELLISPAFFRRLAQQSPEIVAVDILVKRGVGDDEMLRYRYDAVLTKGPVLSRPEPQQWLDYVDAATFSALVQQSEAESFAVSGVPNTRIMADLAFLTDLQRWNGQRMVHPSEDAGTLSAAALAESAALETLLQQAELRGYQVAMTWSGNNASTLDIMFSRTALPQVQPRQTVWPALLTNFPYLDSACSDLVQQISDYAAAALPPYMLPQLYIVLPQLPRNSSGKVEKKALPQPLDVDLQKEQYTAARNQTEQMLCNIWQDLLHLMQVGINDNFFALGGHSLLATRLISAIRQQFRLELPLAVIFECPTIAMLAPRLQRAQRQDSVLLPAVLPVDRHQTLALSFAQQRLWFIDTMQQGSPEYNMSGCFAVSGEFSAECFGQALRQLIERHEVLRTCFQALAGEPRQVVLQDYTLPYQYADWSAWSEPQCRQALQQLLADESRRPFRLDQDLMIRLHVLKLNSGTHLVIYSTHHIASDGWSVRIMQQELTELYQAAVQQRPAQLPVLTVQYADYAMWQRQWFRQGRLADELAYWQQQLAALPAAHQLPLDQPRPIRPCYEGAVIRQLYPADGLTAIQQVCRQYDVTLFMFLDTVFALLLHKYSNSNDIVFGSPVAGRTHQDVEHLIGFFVNTLVLRHQLAPEQSCAALLQANKQMLLDAYAHQHVPFEMLVEALSPDRQMNVNPLFQIVFALQNQQKGQWGMADDSLVAADLGLADYQEQRSTRFDLELNVSETADGLQIQWLYNTALFAATSVQRMAQGYQLLLQAFCQALLTGGAGMVGDLLLLSDTDRDWLLPALSAQAAHQALQQALDLSADQCVVLADANSRCLILDCNLQLVPRGAVGALYLSVPPALQNLLNDLPEQQLRYCPVVSGHLLLATGSTARWDAKNNLELLSRHQQSAAARNRSRQIRSVQNLLAKHPAVQQVAVVELVNASGDQELTACWVRDTFVDDFSAVAELQLRLQQYVRQQPAMYLLPKRFVLLPELPQHRQHGVDQEQLLQLLQREEAVLQYMAPRNQIEQSLCEIWQQVLGKTQIGVEDNFFKIGGHSLLATRITSAIQQQFTLDLPISVLFEAPTIAALATWLARKLESQLLPPLLPARRDQPLLLSYAQQRLWFIDQLGEDSVQYNVSGRLDLPEDLDPEAFRLAFQQLLQRHEVLRTCIVTEQGEPQQHILHDFPLPLIQTDLTGFSYAGRNAELDRLAKAEASRPFDLNKDLALRMHLFRLDHHAYVVLYTMHHIASDGWSMQILSEELQALYQAALTGQDAQLPELAIQYADYAQWQRQWLCGEVLEQQMEYWLERLAGVPMLHSLPLDKPRPRQLTTDGHKFTQWFDRSLSQKIHALARQQQVTLFMLMQTIFAVLLAQYSQNKDILVGSPMSGRNHKDLEPLIGFFVNSLLLRTDVSDNPTFSELLSRNKQLILDAYAHQHTPFEMLVERLRPERHLNYNPIYQISFTTQMGQQQHFAQWSDDDSNADDFAVKETSIRFDLMLHVKEAGDEISLGWSYNTALFHDDSIMAMARNFRALTEAVLDTMKLDPWEQPGVADLPMLESSELQWLLTQPRQQAAVPALALHQLFMAQARRTPDQVALSCQDQTMSYAELDQRSDQLACLLHRQGVKADSRVALYFAPGFAAHIAMLAVLKSGGAYLHLDVNYPPMRCQQILADSGAMLVLSLSAVTLSAEHSGGVPQLWLDTPETVKALIDTSGLTVLPPVSPRDLAYVLYTSGSTGRPKGVMVEHHAAVDYCLQAMPVFYTPELAGAILTTSLSFDATIASALFPLFRGGRVEIRTGSVDLARLWQQLADCREDYLVKLTPSHVRVLALLPAPLPRSMRRHSFVVGGEAFGIAELQRLQQCFPQAKIFNQYGPTEAVVGSTWADLTGFDAVGTQPVPVGCAYPNTSLYVLDEQGRLLPRGAVGILHIGGVGLARGYLNQESLTAQRFTADPFADTASTTDQPARLYNSGDLMRWNPQGQLEFIGRADDQVKLRGFRIELGEIRARLEQHPAIRHCLVLLRSDLQQQPRLVAWYVPSGDELPPTPAELREFAAAALPEYMIPTAWVQMTEFRLTVNGKVDHKALPEPDQDALATQQYQAPQTPTEQVLCQIWAQLLALDSAVIGRTDNFFALGGHSLLVMRMLAELQQHGLSAQVSDVVGVPDLATLAQLLDQQAGSMPAFVIPPNLIPSDCQRITPEMLPLVTLNQQEIDHIVSKVPGGAGMVQDIYPLVSLQEGIYFHHLLNPRHDPYVESKLLLLDSRAHVDLLIGALQMLIDRHDIYRTSVISAGVSQPVQVVWRQAQLPVETTMLDPERDTAEQLHQLAQNQPMVLEQAPMLRVRLAQVPHSEQWYFILQYHHLVSDHESSVIMAAEISAYASGEAHLLTPSVPYRNFVAHTRHQLDTVDAKGYFSRLLADVTEPTLPCNLNDVYGDGRQVDVVRQALDEALGRQIRQCARELQISSAVIFHAAWAWVVGTFSGRQDVVFGTVLSGRMQSVQGVDGALGMFINTLPLRVRLQDVSLSTLVRNTDAALKELLSYEQASLSLAQQCSGIDSGTPLFSAVFNYRHGGKSKQHTDKPVSKSGIRTVSVKDRTNYPFALSVNDLGDEFSFDAQIDHSVSGARVLSYMNNALRHLVSALCRQDPRPISCFTLLSKQEQYQLVEQWNSTDSGAMTEAFAHQQFEYWARETPAATALCWQQQRFSYAELNQQANQLAHLLRSKGIQAESRVGLCIERSPLMIVALLAIVKSGGCYVPIDPELPPSRLAYIASNSQCGLLLTQQQFSERFSTLSDCELLVLDTPSLLSQLEVMPAQDPTLAEVPCYLDQSVYTIYTSGSTGLPKGVQLTQRGLRNLVHCQRDLFALTQRSVVLQVASLSFDAATWEIFMALTNGACLVLISEEQQKSMDQLKQLINDRQVTHATLSPSVLNLLQPHELPGLQTLIVAGEAVTEKAARQWSQDRLFFNAYGPTETTVCATAGQYQGGTVSIGRALAHLSCYVLDEYQQLVPAGVAGILYVAGPALARGYLGQPGKTAERFLPDPFREQPGARMYNTGDLVRWSAQGELEFIGRSDKQIKVRGMRIEPGEIENALLKAAEIQEALVQAVPGLHGQRQLAAYLVPATALADKAETVRMLREQLAVSLPKFMVPELYVWLEQMPLTSNGKVDIAALPVPGVADLIRPGYTGPRNAVEATLCRLWQELLGVEQVGIYDDFYALGGHSLIATRLISAIRHELQVELPLKALLECSCIARLSERLIGCDEASMILPLSQVQGASDQQEIEF